MENNIHYTDAPILLHPNFPAKLLLEIFNKITYDSQFHQGAMFSYLFKAIENPNSPTDFLESLAKHKNVAVRYRVAGHLNTSPKATAFAALSIIVEQEDAICVLCKILSIS